MGIERDGTRAITGKRRTCRAHCFGHHRGRDLVADLSGAFFWESERLLVVPICIWKGSSFAARGVLLPPYDTVATLSAAGDPGHDPRTVIALGDQFSRSQAHERL